MIRFQGALIFRSRPIVLEIKDPQTLESLDLYFFIGPGSFLQNWYLKFSGIYFYQKNFYFPLNCRFLSWIYITDQKYSRLGKIFWRLAFYFTLKWYLKASLISSNIAYNSIPLWAWPCFCKYTACKYFISSPHLKLLSLTILFWYRMLFKSRREVNVSMATLKASFG
jgi:hypothetical protein